MVKGTHPSEVYRHTNWCGPLGSNEDFILPKRKLEKAEPKYKILVKTHVLLVDNRKKNVKHYIAISTG